MTEWTVNLWGPNQPGGTIHKYTGHGDDGIVAAAEALAHFWSLDPPPSVDLDSRLEIAFHNTGGPEQVISVQAILKYLRDNSPALAGIENPRDLDVLEDLADHLGV